MLTLEDVGCLADGVLGVRHLRLTLASLCREALQSQSLPALPLERRTLSLAERALRAAVSDDDGETDSALLALNAVYCSPSVYLSLEGGDLVLWPVED